MVEKMVGAINRALLPQLQEMKGELKAINARLDAADAKAESFRNEFRSEIKRLDEKIDINSQRLEEKIGSLGEKVDSLASLSLTLQG